MPSGIRHAELVNWTGQALLCPTSRIGELAGWEAIGKRPPAYFLLGAVLIHRVEATFVPQG